MENPARQSWREITASLADELDIPRANIIPSGDWLDRVRHYSDAAEADDPAKKVIEFLDDQCLRMACGGLVLDSRNSTEHSKTLASAEPVSTDPARKYVYAWKNMQRYLQVAFFGHIALNAKFVLVKEKEYTTFAIENCYVPVFQSPQVPCKVKSDTSLLTYVNIAPVSQNSSLT